MRSRTVIVCEGEKVGFVDWSHPTAKNMPEMWHEAEIEPSKFMFNGREIIQICMYDGWPYWTPTPAVHFIGPLNLGEWDFFNSYGVNAGSISRRHAVNAP